MKRVFHVFWDFGKLMVKYLFISFEKYKHNLLFFGLQFMFNKQVIIIVSPDWSYRSILGNALCSTGD